MSDLLPFPSAAATSAPPDAPARAGALDVRRSFIVEAPAGSGKTGLLIQRYLKLLADDSVTSPEQVLAITFTNKATAELRDRILAQLVRASESVPHSAGEYERQTRALAQAALERDRQLQWSLLDQPHRLNIRTIDSVCAEIARALPVLSGSGGRLSPVEDARPLHREAARRTLLLLGTGDSVFDQALSDLLLHRDGNLAECEALLADMLSLRDQWARLVPLNPAQLDDASLDANLLPRLEAALDHAICTALTHIEQIFPADLLAELSILGAQMAHAPGYKNAPSPLAICQGQSQPPAAVAESLSHWRALAHLLVKPSKPAGWRKSVGGSNLQFEIEPHHAATLRRLIERISSTPALFDALCAVQQLPPAQYPAEQWAVAKSLFRVLARALIQLQLVFAERRECDFTQLSLLAGQALAQDSGPEDLASALGARIEHLLVDEMQDTSTSQYDLLQRLTATWDGHSQTVFLVGDPRQSIYLFRQARVERFVHALSAQCLGDIPLTPLRLTANFRSQSTLVQQFNDGFSRIFPAPSSPLPYQAVQSTRPPFPASPGIVWHARIIDAPLDQAPLVASRIARENADEVLRIARTWLARPLPSGRTRPWKLAVLVRSRNHLLQIVAALRQQSDPIPFRAVEIETLDERQEVLDLTALTRALLHPADRVATLALLRAPWCGLPLADLHTLTCGDDPARRRESIQRLMTERGSLLPQDSRVRMERLLDILNSAQARRGSLTAAQLVERAWRSLGGDAWLTQEQLLNTRRFFHLLDDLEGSGTQIDLNLLNTRLCDLFAEPAPIDQQTSCIELLTIHKAKGLEWDVVFVPALEKGVNGNNSRLLSWSEIDTTGPADDREAHIMLAPIAGKGQPSQALNQWLNCIHRTREMDETKRLFYVACTRAREELHLFATPRCRTSGELVPRRDSLLHAAWAAAAPHFVSSMQAIAERRTADKSDEADRSAAFDIAAAAAPHASILQRVPAGFDPASAFEEALAHKLSYPVSSQSHKSAGSLSRPQGSIAVRAFGNAVHACLELLSSRISNGESPAVLHGDATQWQARAAALLRAHGLAPAIVQRLARDARSLIEATLRDPAGLWLLGPRDRAHSEFAFTSSLHGDSDAAVEAAVPGALRVDRIFDAGPEPLTQGDDFLWIVDYKTASPGGIDRSTFLASQRSRYAPQLETYARALAAARGRSLNQVRLALYFPAIPCLEWWPAALAP